VVQKRGEGDARRATNVRTHADWDFQTFIVPCLSAPAPPSSTCCQLSKFLPNATKEQQAYKAQRTKTTMLYDMDAVSNAAGRGMQTDPIAAALAAHGACLSFAACHDSRRGG